MRINLTYEEATALINPFADGRDLSAFETSALAKVWNVINTCREAGEQLQGPIRTT